MRKARGHRKLFGWMSRPVLALGLAGLVFLAGCGGAGLHDGSTPNPAEDSYVQVRMRVGADYNMINEMGVGKSSVFKADLANVSCEIFFDPAGTGATPGGISILQAGQIYPDDCPEPPGAGMCIRCINEYKFLDEDGVTWNEDPTQSHCVGTCVGVVPEVLLESDTIPVQIIFYSEALTSITQAGMAMIRTDGSATNAPFLTSDLLDIHSFASDDYIYTGCNGNPDPPEMTMTLSEPILGGFDSYSDPGTGTISWTKAFTIIDMGQPDPGTGLNKCNFQTDLDGGLPVSANQDSGTIGYTVKFCADMQSCPAFGAGGFLDTQQMTFFDGWNSPLDGLDEAMLTPELGMNFETSMVSSSINTDTVVIESTNLGYGLVQPALTTLAASYDRNDGITADDFVVQIANAFKYQLHDFVQMIWDVVSQNNETLSAPIFLEFSSGCAISDEIAKNSQVCYSADTSITNETFTPTLGDWQAINAATALEFAVTNDDVLKYSDAGKTAGQVQSLRIDKLVDIDESWQVEARLESVVGFMQADSKAGDADFIRVGVLDSTYSGYMIGIEALEDPDLVGVYRQSSFVLRYLNGVVQEGAYVVSSEYSEMWLQLSYEIGNQQIIAKVSYDQGQNWTDIVQSGILYPGAVQGSRIPSYVVMQGDHNALIEAYSRPDAVAKDSRADIDQIRWYGIDNSGNAQVDQYSDDDYVESPPS